MSIVPLLLFFFSFYIRLFTLFPHSPFPFFATLTLVIRLASRHRPVASASSSTISSKIKSNVVEPLFLLFCLGLEGYACVRARVTPFSKLRRKFIPDLVSFTSLVFYLSARERIKHRLLNSLQIPPAAREYLSPPIIAECGNALNLRHRPPPFAINQHPEIEISIGLPSKFLVKPFLKPLFEFVHSFFLFFLTKKLGHKQDIRAIGNLYDNKTGKTVEKRRR